MPSCSLFEFDSMVDFDLSRGFSKTFDRKNQIVLSFGLLFRFPFKRLTLLFLQSRIPIYTQMFWPPYGVQGFEFHSFLFVESNFLKNKTFSSHCWSTIRPVGISKGLVCIRPNHRLAAGMWHIISTGCPNQLLNSSARPNGAHHAASRPAGRGVY